MNGYWLTDLTRWPPTTQWVAYPAPRLFKADVTTDWVWFDQWGKVHTHIRVKAGHSGMFRAPSRAPTIYRSKAAA